MMPCLRGSLQFKFITCEIILIVLSSITKKGEIESASRPISVLVKLMTIHLECANALVKCFIRNKAQKGRIKTRMEAPHTFLLSA
jgi:hypothetical protein